MSALGHNGHFAAQSPCPLYPRKRTCRQAHSMSALCQSADVSLNPRLGFQQTMATTLSRANRMAWQPTPSVYCGQGRDIVRNTHQSHNSDCSRCTWWQCSWRGVEGHESRHGGQHYRGRNWRWRRRSNPYRASADVEQCSRQRGCWYSPRSGSWWRRHWGDRYSGRWAHKKQDGLKNQISALGQKRTFAVQKRMSALPPKADIRT